MCVWIREGGQLGQGRTPFVLPIDLNLIMVCSDEEFVRLIAAYLDAIRSITTAARPTFRGKNNIRANTRHSDGKVVVRRSHAAAAGGPSLTP